MRFEQIKLKKRKIKATKKKKIKMRQPITIKIRTIQTEIGLNKKIFKKKEAAGGAHQSSTRARANTHL